MKRAFTLSEVLITVGIIGIVSAMTMPVIINNYQKHETINHLKQTYSLIYQAFQMAETEYGFLDSWDIPNANWDANTYNYGKTFFDQYIKSYLKIIKACKYKSNECWADSYKRADGKVDNSYWSAKSNNTYTVVLANGSVIGFWPRGTWGEIYIDLNGKKGPNTYGKDAFNITFNKNVSKNKIRFYGYSENRDSIINNTSEGCSKQNKGTTCGALIMLDGWKISDDYPW